MNIKSKKLFLFDLDGTIYNDGVLFDGAIDLLNKIKEDGNSYLFMSNNSSKSVKIYVKNLNKMGIKACYDDFYISSQATSYYLNQNHKDELIYVQGTKALVNQLKHDGVKVTTKYDETVKAIVIGFDRELTTKKLERTTKLLTKLDVEYIGTNPDLVCPVSYGFVPDCGSMAIGLFNATKKTPKYIGKPTSLMVDIILKKYNLTQKDLVLVGDRLYTDIACGINAKIDTICVLSGESNKEDVDKSEYKPTLVLDSVKDILEMLK